MIKPRSKKKQNVARQSGYHGASTAPATASMGNRNIPLVDEEKSNKPLDTSKLTKEQKIKLRAAGYLNIEK